MPIEGKTVKEAGHERGYERLRAGGRNVLLIWPRTDRIWKLSGIARGVGGRRW